jgi:hypothetical protein
VRLNDGRGTKPGVSAGESGLSMSRAKPMKMMMMMMKKRKRMTTTTKEHLMTKRQPEITT